MVPYIVMYACPQKYFCHPVILLICIFQVVDIPMKSDETSSFPYIQQLVIPNKGKESHSKNKQSSTKAMTPGRHPTYTLSRKDFLPHSSNSKAQNKSASDKPRTTTQIILPRNPVKLSVSIQTKTSASCTPNVKGMRQFALSEIKSPESAVSLPGKRSVNDATSFSRPKKAKKIHGFPAEMQGFKCIEKVSQADLQTSGVDNTIQNQINQVNAVSSQAMKQCRVLLNENNIMDNLPLIEMKKTMPATTTDLEHLSVSNVSCVEEVPSYQYVQNVEGSDQKIEVEGILKDEYNKENMKNIMSDQVKGKVMHEQNHNKP